MFEVSLLPNTCLILQILRLHKNSDAFCKYKWSHLYLELLEKSHTVCTNLCLLLKIWAIAYTVCHINVARSLMFFFTCSVKSECVKFSDCFQLLIKQTIISLNAYHTKILIGFFPRAGEKYLKSAIVSKRLEQ